MPDGTESGGAGKGNRNPATHVDEKSDIPIVLRKSSNNGCSPAEAMEGREIAEKNGVGKNGVGHHLIFHTGRGVFLII